MAGNPAVQSNSITFTMIAKVATPAIEENREFAEKLIGLANEFSINPIVKYANELLFAIENYQLNKLEKMLEEFKNIDIR